MSEAEARSEPVLRAEAALVRKADGLARSWIAEVRRTCDIDGIGDSADGLLQYATPVVQEVVSRIHDSSGDGGTPDPAHAEAFVAEALRAGLELPVLLRSADLLSEVLVTAALTELEDTSELEATEAFRLADRIHRAVRPFTAAVADSHQSAAEPTGSADERFSSFTRAISHELKNPLGAARGAAELLLSGEGTESEEMRERFTELVLRNINRTLELLEDVRARET